MLIGKSKVIGDYYMYKKGNYEDCLKFIKNVLHIHLLDIQKKMIKAYYEDEKIVITGRGIGKTMCINAYNAYIKHINSVILDEDFPDEAYVRK